MFSYINRRIRSISALSHFQLPTALNYIGNATMAELNSESDAVNSLKLLSSTERPNTVTAIQNIITQILTQLNDQISNSKGLVTLALDRVILHIIVHHSSTSTYMPNFIEIEETFCGRTDVRMDERTDI